MASEAEALRYFNEMTGLAEELRETRKRFSKVTTPAPLKTETRKEISKVFRSLDDLIEHIDWARWRVRQDQTKEEENRV